MRRMISCRNTARKKERRTPRGKDEGRAWIRILRRVQKGKTKMKPNFEEHETLRFCDTLLKQRKRKLAGLFKTCKIHSHSQSCSYSFKCKIDVSKFAVSASVLFLFLFFVPMREVTQKRQVCFTPNLRVRVRVESKVLVRCAADQHSNFLRAFHLPMAFLCCLVCLFLVFSSSFSDSASVALSSLDRIDSKFASSRFDRLVPSSFLLALYFPSLFLNLLLSQFVSTVSCSFAALLRYFAFAFLTVVL